MVEFWSYLQEHFPQLFGAAVLGAALGTLLTMWISHRLAKSRDLDSFKRNVHYKESEDNKITSSLLGQLANDILKCWQEATIVFVVASRGTELKRMTADLSITLADYSTLKPKLVDRNALTPRHWQQLDRLPERVDNINTMINERPQGELRLQRDAFYIICELSYWTIRYAYIDRGGNEDDLADFAHIDRPNTFRWGP